MGRASIIKIIPRILLITVIFILACALLAYGLLWLPGVQQKIKDIALTELMKKTGNRMSIGNIQLRPFNSLVLKQVYVEDLKGDTLLYADHFSGNFSLLELLNSRLLITGVDVKDFEIFVSKDSVDSDFNFNFFVEAFASEDTTTKSESNLVIQIENISLENGNVSYHIHAEEKTPGIFNPNHIVVQDLSAKIDLNSIDPEKLDITIHSLLFQEQSGLGIRDLSGELTSSDKKIQLKDLFLQLNDSEPIKGNAEIDYSGSDISRLAEAAAYSISIGTEGLNLNDLQAFYPLFKNASTPLVFEGKITGKLPEINIESIRIDYGSHLSLAGKARLSDYEKWQSSPLELDIERLVTNAKGIDECIQLTGNNMSVQNMFQAGNVRLSGTAAGSLPELVLDLEAGLPKGVLKLTGTGGYDYDSGDSKFDAELISKGTYLNALLKNMPIGLANLTLKAKGNISGNGRMNIAARTAINQLGYGKYVFNRITGAVNYINDSITINAVSRDLNFPLTLAGYYNMRPKVPTAEVEARLTHVKPQAAGLLPIEGDPDISGRVFAKTTGIDPENMQAQVRIDSLQLKMKVDSLSYDSISQNTISLFYLAGKDREKKVQIDSEILSGNVSGSFSLDMIGQSLINTLAVYLPAMFESKTQRTHAPAEINASLNLKNTTEIARLFRLPVDFPEPATMYVSYREQSDAINLHSDIPVIRTGEMQIRDIHLALDMDSLKKEPELTLSGKRTAPADTLVASLRARLLKENNIGIGLNVLNNSAGLNMEGSITGNVELSSIDTAAMPAIRVNLDPSEIKVNDSIFTLQPSQLTILNEYYAVNNFKISLSENEFFEAQGVISKNEEDSLTLNLSHVQLGNLLKILKYDIGVEGEANGRVVLNRLLTSPRIFTRGLSVNGISVYTNPVGDLNLSSLWNSERQAVFFKAELTQSNNYTSSIAGYAVPEKDSLSVRANLNMLQLEWIDPMVRDFLFGLKGALDGNIHIQGKMSNPELLGVIRAKEVGFGINMTGVSYSIDDSISISPGQISFSKFTIKDETGSNAVINGKVNYQSFSSFKPNINVKVQNLLVVNNPTQTDSLFYGTLRISGNIDVTGSEKEILAKMTLNNSGGKSRLFVKIPDEYIGAEEYTSVTFINPNDSIEELQHERNAPPPPASSGSLPLRLQLLLSVDHNLTAGAVINPATKDVAYVTGGGKIDFTYNMANGDMNLLGDYRVEDGQCSISIKNITKKTFKVQEGGTVTFVGDPMATSFDVTAIYSLRTALSTLDQAFMENTARIPVNCLVSVSGNLDKMDINYDIELPTAGEEAQRKIDGLLYTDELKMKQIAYLLVVGTFLPISSTETQSFGNNLWTMLASNQINNLLSGVLGDNWSIGTELHADDNDMSNLEMDVNVSTRLFNDRLTINGNFGYNNSAAASENFTGDFDIQYKLTKSGDVVLKVYSITNQQLYEQVQSPVTQGLGVTYRKEAKTFKGLFDKIKNLFRRRK